MFRKSLLAIAAAATMAIGVGATSVPAEAGHKPNFNLHITIGKPHFRHNHGHCHFSKVWRHGHWVRVKSCHQHRHNHGHH